MNRTQKAETVASLNGAFAEAALVVVTHNTELAARCPIRFELVGERLEQEKN